MKGIKDNERKKNLLLSLGFEEEIARIESGNCPFCGNPVKMEDFKDELSIREYYISGLCQSCQKFFDEEEIQLSPTYII